MKNKGVLVVISGFSGAGKGTLMKNLISKYDYALSISMTTRQPRAGEVHGREYFFVTRDEFEQTIDKHGLIEYADYCGNYYGTPREYVEKQLESGRDVILEIEAQGAAQVKKFFPESLLIFVITPNVSELFHRLKGRGTETEEVIGKRMKRASEEVDFMADYDAIIVNDNLEECTDRLHGIIRAAGYSVSRNRDFIEGFREQFKSFFERGEL